MPKVESEAQCTGETRYADDVPPAGGELHGAFVVSTMAACELDKVDPSEALVSSILFLNRCVPANVADILRNDFRKCPGWSPSLITGTSPASTTAPGQSRSRRKFSAVERYSCKLILTSKN